MARGKLSCRRDGARQRKFWHKRTKREQEGRKKMTRAEERNGERKTPMGPISSRRSSENGVISHFPPPCPPFCPFVPTSPDALRGKPEFPKRKKFAGFVRFGRAASDGYKRGDARPHPPMPGMETRTTCGRRGWRGGRISTAGGWFWLVSGGRAVAYSGRAARGPFTPSAGEHTGPVSAFSTANPLSQAASSPKLPQSFDDAGLHARDAPWRVLSGVLFRGVVTLGLGMTKAAPFLSISNANPNPPKD